MIHGTDDQASGISAAEYLPKRLERHGKTNYRLLMYPGAGHLIEPPHSPCCYASYNKLMRKLYYDRYLFIRNLDLTECKKVSLDIILKAKPQIHSYIYHREDKANLRMIGIYNTL